MRPNAVELVYLFLALAVAAVVLLGVAVWILLRILEEIQRRRVAEDFERDIPTPRPSDEPG